ncbi:MAG TPA: hypothetical protein VN258_18465 [Mobilitalea sp.]|nr:hypothetical protein [Mobilitalea sp.]
MLKKSTFKLGLCFAFLFLFLVSFKSTNAYAAETKDVTVTVHQNVTVPDTVISNVLQSISTSTYSYDDGSYKGTLNYSGISGMSQTFYAQYPSYTLYTYSFDVTYSGTVTKYVPVTTKDVTVTVHYNINVPNTVINNVLQSISSSTYSYDDGSYKGTLNYAGISGMTQTFYAQYPSYTIYTYSFDVIYAGTATSY